MSKKKPAKKARAASKPRRKATKARRAPKAKPRMLAAPKTVQLKPIKVLVDRAIEDLKRLPPTEVTDITIKHLETCAMAFEDICDPNTPGGCAPTMEFPRET